MRLLNIYSRRLELFYDEKSIRYAILSHTWSDHEPTFQDFCQDPDSVISTSKIKGFLESVLHREDESIKYVWIDTICIDKTSSAELQEAINCMYRWYQNAVSCYAYLKDVDANPSKLEPPTTPAILEEEDRNNGKNTATWSSVDQAIINSRWFTRGWTLQELIAPSRIAFYDTSWFFVGAKVRDKGRFMSPTKPWNDRLATKDIIPQIHEATGIPVDILMGTRVLEEFSVGQRLSWASKRKTTREEDMAYCLMGLFGVNMPMLYGEGSSAFFRLREEIMKNSDDHSLFAYDYNLTPVFKTASSDRGERELSLQHYAGCDCIEQLQMKSIREKLPVLSRTMEHHFMTNKGLCIELDTVDVPGLPGTFAARLNCIIQNKGNSTRQDRVITIPLYQHPTLVGTKIVQRRPCVPLVSVPMSLFTPHNTKPSQLYISNNPYGIEQPLDGLRYLRFQSYGHSFNMSEIYPATVNLTRTREPYYDTEAWTMRLVYPYTSPPPLLYIRMQSEWRNISFLVKLELQYDKALYVDFFTCSVSALPPGASLLELLLQNKYPEPLSEPQVIKPCLDSSESSVYVQELRYESKVNVQVRVEMSVYKNVDVTISADDTQAEEKRPVDGPDGNCERLIESRRAHDFSKQTMATIHQENEKPQLSFPEINVQSFD
ncbi:hypothetical protein SEUCBS140593_006816 [Sporothrix eucalyptigena]|uniref:Heterokaryon incompatibility domain-containing protein n=1 Tax=Sporothrix eucalyptigena TaxID=1812306 RepID=A0ABP0C8B4_9PEZI